MAAVGSKRPREELEVSAEFTCALCLHVFLDPVTVGCGHAFCLGCLQARPTPFLLV
jgi:hypothetical protein